MGHALGLPITFHFFTLHFRLPSLCLPQSAICYLLSVTRAAYVLPVPEISGCQRYPSFQWEFPGDV